jgi:hypothetical protein
LVLRGHFTVRVDDDTSPAQQISQGVDGGAAAAYTRIGIPAVGNDSNVGIDDATLHSASAIRLKRAFSVA